MPRRRPGRGWRSHSIDEASSIGVASMVKRLKGTSILSVALDLCHHAFVMDIGRIVRSGSGAELLADPIVRDAYLGVLEE